MNMFRNLDEHEVFEFKKWARENYKPGEDISSLWHPVVQEECKQMNNEVKEEMLKKFERDYELYDPINGHYPIAYLHREDITALGYDEKEVSENDLAEIRRKIEESIEYAFHHELLASLQELNIPKL